MVFCIFARQSFSFGTRVGTSMLSLFNGHELQGFGAQEVWKMIRVKTYPMGPCKGQAGVGKRGAIKKKSIISVAPLPPPPSFCFPDLSKLKVLGKVIEWLCTASWDLSGQMFLDLLFSIC